MNSIAPVCQARSPMQFERVSQSQSAEITIVTAEGDTVTLSSNIAAQLDYSTYNAQGQVGLGAGLMIQRDVAIKVDGDLSKAELKDIRKTLKILEKAAQDMASGDAGKAARRTSHLEGLESIAQLNAEIAISKTVVSQTGSVPA